MEFNEETIKSKIVYDGKILTVYKDDVEISDGTKAFREVVKHSGGVVILAVKEDKILLVKQFRYPMKQAMFELPAGKLEKDENPFEAAKRELEEETGYRAKNWTDLGYIFTSPGYSNEKLYLYKAENLTFTKCKPDKGEIIQAFEFDKKDVLKMMKSGEISDAKSLCAFMRAFS